MDIARLGVHESVRELAPPERFVDALSPAPVDVRVVGAETSDVDAVVSFRPAEWFVGLEWVHCVRAGYDEFPVDAYRAAGTALTNSSGVNAGAVGEHVLGLMLSFARRLHRYRDAQAAREWAAPAWDEPFTLRGEQLAVVGLGAVGRSVASRADGVGMCVAGVRRTPVRVPHVHDRYSPDDLREAVADARFVVLAVPLNDATRGLVDAAVFEAMREDAVLVNVSRGPVVDEAALLDALDSGAIAGAGLDVFGEEPLPEASPLWERENVVVTPHAAAAYREYYRDVAALVAENARSAVSGGDLHNRVV